MPRCREELCDNSYDDHKAKCLENPLSETDDIPLVTVHGWEGKKHFPSGGVTAGQIRTRVAAEGWPQALDEPLYTRRNILVPDDTVITDMGNDVELVVRGRLCGGVKEDMMAKLQREFEKLAAEKRKDAGVTPAMAATAARRATKEFQQRQAEQTVRDRIEKERQEASRMQQHGRTLERAMKAEDDHMLMNLALHASTQQKALKTLETILKPSKSPAKGPESLDSSLKILACILRGRLLNEVDVWPQRMVALATHHTSYRLPGDKVTLSIQNAARDKLESITSKKIEGLVQTAILPEVKLDNCAVTAIDNSIPKERMPRRCFVQDPKREPLTASPPRLLFTVRVEVSDPEAPSLYRALQRNRGP